MGGLSAPPFPPDPPRMGGLSAPPYPPDPPDAPVTGRLSALPDQGRSRRTARAPERAGLSSPAARAARGARHRSFGAKV